MSEFNPLVSIIIPVYNGANYMREAIDSALAQTYRNCEVIVVNDGSRDDGETANIAKSYGVKIKYIEKPNGGVASALNAGISAMSGEYFSWLSHDDIYAKNKIELQINFLAMHDNRDVVLFSDYMTIDHNGNELYPVKMDHDLLTRKPMYAVFRGALNGCTMLIPKAAFDKVGVFDDLPTTQDYDMWFRLIRKFAFVHQTNVLLFSRIHSNQGSNCQAATDEANQLWIRLMASLSADEVLSMEGNEQRFWGGMVSFFRDKPYELARKYAEQRMGIVRRILMRYYFFGKVVATTVNRTQSRLHSFSLSENIKHILEIHTFTRKAIPYLARMRRSLKACIAKASGRKNYVSDNFRCMEYKKADNAGMLGAIISIANQEMRCMQSNSNESPLVSVVIPTYNRAHSLPLALYSALAQSYSNIEIIVVDDASNDSTSELIKSFQKMANGRLRYAKNNRNEGASFSRNLGINMSNGQYIAFLDSDDMYYPKKIERQVSSLQKSKCSVFSCTWYVAQEVNDGVLCQQTNAWDISTPLYPTFLMPKHTAIVTPSVMVTRDALFEYGLFDTSMSICEDLDLWAKMLQTNHGIMIPEPLTMVATRRLNLQKIPDYLLARDYLYKKIRLRDRNLNDNFLAQLYMDLFKIYLDLSNLNNFSGYNHILEELSSMDNSSVEEISNKLYLLVRPCVRSGG